MKLILADRLWKVRPIQFREATLWWEEGRHSLVTANLAALIEDIQKREILETEKKSLNERAISIPDNGPHPKFLNQ